MKVLIVGGVAGGASTATRLRRLNEEAEIIMFERGEHVSYSNCCLPYFLSREIPTKETLILNQPSYFINRYDIDTRVGHEVVKIDREKKTVTVECKNENKTYEETYDVLVLSPGAEPVIPGSIPGVDSDKVFTVRNVNDIVALDDNLHQTDAKHVTVVGGGFIGIEITENLIRAGYKVSLIEAADQVMTPFDEDMAQMLHKELVDRDVDLHLSSPLKEVMDGAVIVGDDIRIPTDAVVLAIGVRPETALAKEAGLKLGETGSIAVDEHYRTSDPSIYAVGDAIEVEHALSGGKVRLALAGPAQRQARAVADNICGRETTAKPVLGSSVVCCFGMNAARTGLNEKECKAAGIKYDYSLVRAMDRVGIMPSAKPIVLKLLFEVPTGKILGAQAVGPGVVDKRVDVIATALRFGATLEDVKDFELCYSPVYGTAKDPVNHAALVGLNLLNGDFRQIPVSEVERLVEEGATIIDVREKGEFAHGHIRGAVNIPMSEFRKRLDEFPRDRRFYIHCGSSLRSYNVYRALVLNGITDVVDIKGSYAFLVPYEYYRTRVLNEESVLER